MLQNINLVFLSYLRNVAKTRESMVVAALRRKINPKEMVIIRLQNMKGMIIIKLQNMKGSNLPKRSLEDSPQEEQTTVTNMSNRPLSKRPLEGSPQEEQTRVLRMSVRDCKDNIRVSTADRNEEKMKVFHVCARIRWTVDANKWCESFPTRKVDLHS